MCYSYLVVISLCYQALACTKLASDRIITFTNRDEKGIDHQAMKFLKILFQFKKNTKYSYQVAQKKITV